MSAPSMNDYTLPDDVDYKRLFFYLLVGCYRNESTCPNIENVYEEEWVTLEQLGDKEIAAFQTVSDELYEEFQRLLRIDGKDNSCKPTHE